MRSRLYIALTLLLVLFACSDKKPTTPIKYPDQIPPARITSLWICADFPTWVSLCWYAPGDDSLSGKATAYEIRYSRDFITDSTWDSCTIVAQSLIPRDPTTGERFRLNGLDSGTTYFAALKAVDDIGNWSGLSNVVAINVNDDRVPRPIVDLVGSVTEDSSLHLSWTVPSFDDSTSPVWGYILRYSNEPIWDYNWQDADSITLSMRAGQAANPDSIRIDWPSSDSILFIRLTTRDVFQHTSTLSNQIQVAHPGVDTIISPPDTSSFAYVEWQKEIPELTGQIVMDVAQTIDRGIAMVSTTEDYWTGYHGIYVTKLDSIGNVVWNRSFTEISDYPAAILELPTGDLLVAGTTRAMGDTLGDACLWRLSSSGDPQGIYPIRVPGPQDIKDAALLESGKIVLVGTRSTAALSITAELNGDTVWSYNYYSGNYCVVEGPTATAASVAVVLGDAGEVVVNINEYYAKGGHSYCGPPFVADLSLITFDATGQITDYTTYGTETWDGWAWAGDLVRASDGSFLVAGWDAVYGTGLFVRSISTARVTQWSYPLLGFAMRGYADVGLYILPDIANDMILIVGDAIEQPNGTPWTSKDIGIEAITSSGTHIGQFTFGESGVDETVEAAIQLAAEQIAIFWRTATDSKVHIGKLRIHQ